MSNTRVPSRFEESQILEQLGEVAQEPGMSSHFWDPPIPIDRPAKKPNYPIGCLPKRIQEYIEALAEQYQVPISYAATCVLAATAMATLKRCVLQAGSGDTTHLNAYFLTTLESGSGKSSCMAQVNGPLYEFEFKLKRDCGPDSESEDLGFISSDPTSEALEKRLRANGGAYAIANAEAGDLFGILCGRYNNGAASFGIYLKGYSGETHRPDRILRGGTSIQNPRLSMNLAIQPSCFDRYWRQTDFVERGFTARFLLDQPDSRLGFRKPDPTPVSPGLRSEWKQTVSELLDIKVTKNDRGEPEPHKIKMSEEARKLLLDFRTKTECELRPEGEWETCREFGARACEHVCKLAGLLHCLDHSKEPWASLLSSQTFNNALELFGYYATFSKGLQMTAAEETRQKQLQYLLEKVQTRPEWRRSFKIRDLYQLVKKRSGIATMDDLRSLLGELEELGYVRSSPPERGKHPTNCLVNQLSNTTPSSTSSKTQKS